jgi:hypothetical protein
MYIAAMSHKANVRIMYHKDGDKYMVDFHEGLCIFVSKWTPAKKPKRWFIETWMPKHNRRSDDIVIANIRKNEKAQADILHMMPSKEFYAMVDLL